MKTPHQAKRLIAATSGSFAILFLASCGDYSTVIPATSQQTVSKMSGYGSLSGRPNLRTPAAIGIFTTGRTDTLDFGKAAEEMGNSGRIRSMQSINAFVSPRDYYQLNDVLNKRAKIINDAKFLGLDIILVCDQMTDTQQNFSLIQGLTLGLLDLGMKKQNTQLTVLCMDARTGYIYGVMGQQEDGHAGRLALFDATILGDPNRSHLVSTTRRDAIKEFPNFWNQIVSKYGK